MKPHERKGYEFTCGAMKCIAEIALWAFLLIVAFSIVSSYFGFGVDDSDVDGWHRSGLRVYTDAKTGVQYLSDGHGGLVKRETGK